MSYSLRSAGTVKWVRRPYYHGGFFLKDLIDHIPFVDLMIVGVLVFFIYLGLKNCLPKLLLTVGAIYTGFLLASIYYHLFGMTLQKMFHMKNPFMANFAGF